MSLITISSPIGCGGEEIARAVANGLDLEVFDDRKLLEIAPAVGIPSEELKGMEEPGFFDRLFSRAPQVYMDYMDSIVYEVAKQGKGVIIGHGSQMLLRDFGCAFHVAVHAPQEVRIKGITEQQGLSEKAADKLINKMDNRRRGFFRVAFHKDLDDPSLYDMIINTSKVRYETAAKLIIEATHSDELSSCSLTALDAMELLSEIKRVEAVLISKDLYSNLMNLDVPEKGVVEIYGLGYSQESIDQIIKTVEDVPGVSEVRSELIVLPPRYGSI
ncbi:MAG: cytidylate kinase-like family protein [Deltaproteobacteria bacterium]|nr:cytidylate kinase-like family protein [Deltaproteobacteria bacterium]